MAGSPLRNTVLCPTQIHSTLPPKVLEILLKSIKYNNTVDDGVKYSLLQCLAVAAVVVSDGVGLGFPFSGQIRQSRSWCIGDTELIQSCQTMKLAQFYKCIMHKDQGKNIKMGGIRIYSIVW